MGTAALQEERGAFSDDAAAGRSGSSIDYLPFIRLKEVFELASQDKV